MADPVQDTAAGKPPASSAAGEEQMKMSDGTHRVTNGIFEAFRRSSTIPTIGKKRRGQKAVERRAPAPAVEPIEEDDAPMTLADLRRQRAAKTVAKPKPRRTHVDEDGGFDVSAASAARRVKSKPQGGASLAAGALAAMRRSKS